MHPQIGLFDVGIGPDALQEFFLADQVLAAVNKHDQKIQRSAPQPQLLSVPKQNPARRIKPEGAKG